MTEDGHGNRFPLQPNDTIGIIGGGQLGRMLASSAARLGFRTIVLESGEDTPAAQMSNGVITAAYDDEAALAQLAEGCSVVTYEFENVPLSAAKYLEGRVKLYPPARALEVSQDRLVEKNFLQDCGIAIAPFRAVENAGDLQAALAEFGGGVLKTRRFGYDGKGQHVFEGPQSEGLDSVLRELGQGPFVLEKLINFSGEFSVIGARDVSGEIATYEPAANRHEDGILRRSAVPADLPPNKFAQAQDVVRNILQALDYVGVIGVEFFETADGVLVNEIAPRVHNSGHWTVEACLVSQFEQHIRAIAGLPLGPTASSGAFEMLNLIGDEANDLGSWFDDPDASVTLYGKREARPGRKMGHVTRRLSS